MREVIFRKFSQRFFSKDTCSRTEVVESLSGITAKTWKFFIDHIYPIASSLASSTGHVSEGASYSKGNFEVRINPNVADGTSSK